MTSGAPGGEAGRWARIEEICFGAMERTPADRSAYLDLHCAGDDALRAEIEALLQAADTRPDFLSRPVLSIPADAGVTEGAPDADLPERVGPYRIIRPLGEGGMGHVYLAVREGEGFSKTVALKVVRRGLDTNRVLTRFREERRILAGLAHPNIAALLDGGATEDGRPYLVMEYVEGEPVDRYCDRRGLSVRDRLRLVTTVCAAVHYAHKNLVVHRDIKPPNILVTDEGIPKLLDFGIGKVLAGSDADEGLTALEERVMTPEYAAPEQRSGGTITTATDVYALGVLLYRLLTGRLPWEGAGTSTGRDRIPTDRAEPRRPSKVSAEADQATEAGRTAVAGRISPELDAVVLKALRSEPEERYPGPLALADDLERFLNGRPVAARPPSLLYLSRKFISRHRVAVAASIAVVAGGLSMTAYTWIQSQRVAAERDKALEVRGFLLETFGAAGPDRETGDPVTARALLDGQAATVVDAYAEDPALRAEMMMVLADGYERLGLVEEAESWASRVVADHELLPDAEHAAAQNLLAWILHQQGRSSEAEALLVEAVARARAASGAERVLARALNDLGVVLEAVGEYDRAGAAHEEALAMRVALFGETHRSVAISASNLAAVHYRRGDLEQAVREGQRALEIIERSLGPDHQRTIIAQSNLAVFKLVQGDLSGAEADYRDLLERQARIQGREHPVTVRVMMSLASVLRQAEKWSEAEGFLREALRITNERPEANPVDVGYTMATLGDILSERGAHREAVEMLERSLELQVGALGLEHVAVAQSQNYLSRAFERVDSLEVAVRWQERAVATLGASLGPDHPQTESERQRLDALHHRVGTGGGGSR